MGATARLSTTLRCLAAALLVAGFVQLAGVRAKSLSSVPEKSHNGFSQEELVNELDHRSNEVAPETTTGNLSSELFYQNQMNSTSSVKSITTDPYNTTSAGEKSKKSIISSVFTVDPAKTARLYADSEIDMPESKKNASNAVSSTVSLSSTGSESSDSSPDSSSTSSSSTTAADSSTVSPSSAGSESGDSSPDSSSTSDSSTTAADSLTVSPSSTGSESSASSTRLPSTSESSTPAGGVPVSQPTTSPSTESETASSAANSKEAQGKSTESAEEPNAATVAPGLIIALVCLLTASAVVVGVIVRRRNRSPNSGVDSLLVELKEVFRTRGLASQSRSSNFNSRHNVP